ncbi:hypothetical protein OG21DRAFT_1166100 [Imleria badia]|nr:hypothetical protein OG21DRAFT_1166100 [Imleria badia]
MKLISILMIGNPNETIIENPNDPNPGSPRHPLTSHDGRVAEESNFVFTPKGFCQALDDRSLVSRQRPASRGFQRCRVRVGSCMMFLLSFFWMHHVALLPKFSLAT